MLPNHSPLVIAEQYGTLEAPGVDAAPGKGARVPLYILGSSVFGAQLAAGWRDMVGAEGHLLRGVGADRAGTG